MRSHRFRPSGIYPLSAQRSAEPVDPAGVRLMHAPQDITQSYRQGLDRQVVLLAGAFWLAFFVLLTSRAYASGEADTTALILARLTISASGFALTYAMHVLFRRNMPERPLARFAKAAAYAFVVAVLLTCVLMIAYSLAMPGDKQARWANFIVFQTWFFAFTSHVWILLAWTAIYAVVINTADLHERDRRLAAAEHAAQQAQLSALRLQIHPHFLFNALNALSGLVTLGRQDDAKKMIYNLSAFLRRTLTADPAQMTTLREEIDMQMMYLGIERTRFPDRLLVECNVPDECLDALVPNLILQPLVENVIKHALAPSETPVTLVFGAARRGEFLEVWIRDDGASASPSKAGLGIGLRNVAERLKALFGDQGNLAAGRDGSCWVSRITTPWKTACVS